jgi:Sulfatase
MPTTTHISSPSSALIKQTLVRYTWLGFGLFLLVGSINFYQILMVAPDTVGMKAFKAAMFSSQGFLQDLGWFLLSTILIHSIFVLLLWLGTVGWLSLPEMRERQRKLSVYLAFAVASAWLWILSARHYPNMPSGFIQHNPVLMADITLYLLSGLVVVSCLVSVYFLSTSKPRKRALGIVVVTFALIVCLPMLIPGTNTKNASWDKEASPNVLIIGIDSLRPDETGYFGSGGKLTPNIDEFLARSTVYPDSYTPYARTFPAWMSILTGKEPVNHKGRFNLIDHSYLDKTQTIAWWLKERGYRTVYGFDERRFNNIDESFGYDAVVGPKPGALGFVLGQYDHPMVNLLSNTMVGKYLLPEMYLNRGRAGNYDPERYSSALIDEVLRDTSKPLFMSAHFLLPHFPWYSRDIEELEKFNMPEEPTKKFAYQYRMMLKQVDRQFGQFMAQLESVGALENTYVFLLSDHGDGFKFEKDILSPAREDAPFELETNTRGHATNVLNVGQYKVVLAGRSYGPDKFQPGNVEGNASLLDIVPTILDALGVSTEGKDIDGLSLLSSTIAERNSRSLFLESGFKTLSVTADDMTEQKLLKEGIKAYTVNKEGKLVVRKVWYENILASKQRSVIQGDWQLSMIPGMGEYMVLTNIAQKKWWSLNQYDGDEDVSEMLASLCENYGGDPGFDPANSCKLYGADHEKIAARKQVSK